MKKKKEKKKGGGGEKQEENQGGLGGRFQREGIYVYLELIRLAEWQKPTQCYKAIIFQFLKNVEKKKKKEGKARQAELQSLMTKTKQNTTKNKNHLRSALSNAYA